MTIVVNIHDGSGVLPAGADAAAPLTGGASVENAPTPLVADLHRDANAAFDGGSPSTMLVQEVEAALLMARAAARDGDATLPGAVDAGAAPI